MNLRELLQKREYLLVAGAHNGLSARLAEEAGFDALWASGFEISASHAVPDANILTMSEALEAAKDIHQAAGIPVIADCDNGFGNAVNARRTVREYEKAGIAAICIEDNNFPKRCSFYTGVKRDLVSAEEHAGKIRAAVAARSSPDFWIIARSESLIAGLGMDDALARCRAYADAGADAILIHSKQSTPDEIFQFAELWDRDVPLVSVPTTYSSVTARELSGRGFRIVIFANHGLRASVRAMRETFKALRGEERTAAVDDRIAALQEIYDIVGVSSVRETEKEFLPRDVSDTRAVILAAGFDPLAADRPKTMLPVRGKPILHHQVEALRGCGIQDIAVVRGHHKEAVRCEGVRMIDNDAFATSGELHSLAQAAEELKGRVVVLYGDVLFDRTIIQRLLASSAENAVVVDRAWQDAPRNGAADLVVESDPPPSSLRYLPAATPGRVLRIGPRVRMDEAHGEFVGLALFSKAEAVRPLLLGGGTLPDLVQRMIDAGHRVDVVGTYKGWLDVDTLADLQRADIEEQLE